MKIAVFDIETTGLDSITDFIVEVGAVLLNLENGHIEPVLDYVCHEKNMSLEKLENSWIIQNSSLTINQVRFSIDFNVLKPKIKALFKRYPVTSYNQKFDFGFFRERGLVPKILAPDPMVIATPIMKLPNLSNKYHGKWKYPSVEEAYKFFLNKDLKEAHRAADDAYKEAQIIWQMYLQNLYEIQLQKI